MRCLHVLFLLLLLTFSVNLKAQTTQTAAVINFTNSLPDWPFSHGVASGDPLPDAVIIWSRVSPDPETADFTIRVKWEMAKDKHFFQPVASGETKTSIAQDFTVKVDVAGLQPGTYYYYRFEAYGKKSLPGRTKTTTNRGWEIPAGFASRGSLQSQKQQLPSPNEQVRLAVVSCNNYEAGYFNAFARIAAIPDLDAVVHLGDYIYEYGARAYGDSSLPRMHVPDHELLTLADYRARYAQYRLDPDLQAAHGMHPFICVWDDHEIANNAHAEGAQNHQPEEGDFEARKRAATQAYYEWLPVRETNAPLYRQFSFGGMVDLFMLDERLAGREAPAPDKHRKHLQVERSMLGHNQREWLFSGLKQSAATWKIIGNQVLFAELQVLPVFPKAFVNLDAWDGYPAERQAIKDFLAENDIANVLFTTGDTHSAWCFDIPQHFRKYRKKRAGKIVAHEFAAPSITSANFDEYKSPKTVRWIEGMLSKPGVNPHLRYLDLSQHGYLLLTLTPYDAVAEWRFVSDITRRTDAEFVGEKRVLRARYSNSLFVTKR
ncbi:MAG: alkaline phosphatase D family protein [Saprospiraceae bacterium]